jgi:phytoene/squalene synthetase
VDSTSGPLEDITANRWSPEHKAYNDAVDEAFKSFLERNNIPSEKTERLTPAQAEEFLDEVFYSSDPRIRSFNMRIWREAFRYWRRSGGARGRGGVE